MMGLVNREGKGQRGKLHDKEEWVFVMGRDWDGDGDEGKGMGKERVDFSR